MLPGSKTKKAVSLASIALIAATSLTACGGGDSSSAGDYCDIYKSAHKTLGDLDLTELNKGEIDKTFDYIKKLEDAAPNDKLRKAWQTSDDTLHQIKKALEDSGMTFSDLGKLKDMDSPSDLPQDISMDDVKKFLQEFKGIDKDKMDQAQETVQDYARKTCNVDV